MNVQDLGSIGELIAAIATLATLIYLAVQIRQNTAQQRREELVSIQHGQNTIVTQLRDPAVIGGYVRTAEERNPSIEDKAAAFSWVVQYLNHFQIVEELHRNGVLGEEQFDVWTAVAVSIVAPKGIWRWWNEEGLRLGFHSEVRELIERKISDADNPPVPITELWSAFSPEAWNQSRVKGERTDA